MANSRIVTLSDTVKLHHDFVDNIPDAFAIRIDNQVGDLTVEGFASLHQFIETLARVISL